MAISRTLPSSPESCPDLPVPVVRLPGAPMPTCTCNLHATCLGIFLIAGLGLGGVLLAYAKRGLFMLCLVHPSKTLRVILRNFYLPQCLAVHVTYTCYVLEAFWLLILV